MALKDRSEKELEERIKKLEKLIHDKGIGSGYLSRAEEVQRNLNLAVFFGGIAAVLGTATWLLYRSNK